MRGNQTDRNNKEESRLSVSSGEQNEKESGDDYVTEFTSPEHDYSSEDEYDSFVLELQMGINKMGDNQEIVIDFDAPEIDLDLDFDPDLDLDLDLDLENSDSMKESTKIGETDLEVSKNDQRSKDTSPFFRRPISVVKRRLILLILVIIFLAAVWTVTSTFTGHADDDTDNPSHSHLGINAHQEQPLVDVSVGDQAEGYVSANVETNAHQKLLASLESESSAASDPSPPLEYVPVGNNALLDPSPSLEYASAMEYKSANMRKRSKKSSMPIP